MHRHPDVRLVLHGHFYQPPRENPWTDRVPREPSAHPYHDWNERIAAECYRPNTASRVLDAYGRIQTIVNNFEHLSFNVGPTLFAWLDRHAPELCARIVAADRASAAARSGHGNALAQAYHHSILPLCNARDRRTQVLWGLREFQHRFKRPAEGIWLPETAIDASTVETLVDCGVRFTILSPYQARRVRALPDGAWEGAAEGRIDPKRPYRIFSDRPGPHGERRHLDVFFYDGPISRAVSFEHLLRDSDDLAARLSLAVTPDAVAPQLVSMAVDGETFGHHEPFADMCIAAFATQKAGPRGFRLTNYAEYLALVPPQHEVELQPGDGGEGTAWSCAHGVGRWRRDCGCSTGAPAGWNQAWRAPLRQALDDLRDAVARAFEERGAEIFHDPWAARDDAIELVLRSDEAAVAETFFARHLRSPGHEHRVAARKLLEAQRHAMAMYTSCAWFFADITGIETVQNIRYAARCVQLMQEFTGEDLEARLVQGLEAARSNNGRDTGATIYRNWVLPELRTARRAANAHAIFVHLDDAAERRDLYGFTLRDTEPERCEVLGHAARAGHLWLRHRRTFEETEISYLVFDYSPRNLRCYLATADAELHQSLRAQVDALRPPLEQPDLERCLAAIYGSPPLGIGDLLAHERRRIAERLAAGRVAGLRQQFRTVFEDSRHLLEDFASLGLELPAEIRVPCEFTLQADLADAAASLAQPIVLERLEAIESHVRLARRLGLRLDLEPVVHRLEGCLLAEMRALLRDAAPERFAAATQLLMTGDRLALSLRRAEAEEILHEFLQQHLVPRLQRADGDAAEAEYRDTALRFAERLNFVSEPWRAVCSPVRGSAA